MNKVNSDHIIGIKTFWTKKPGIGGSIKVSPSDFVVREVWKDNLVVGRNTITPMKSGGLHLHFTLEKKGIDTLNTIRFLAKKLRRSINDFVI